MLTARQMASIAAAAWDAEHCSSPVAVVDSSGADRYVRCGTRFADRCAYCARLTAADWGAILRSGVLEVEDIALHRFVFLTLTAPTFGVIHRVPKPGAVAIPCTCGVRHRVHERDLRGVPVDPIAYDYAGQVAWNRDCGRLWDRTRTRLARLLIDLDYSVVREWQYRGVLHFHALLRFGNASAVTAAEIEGGGCVQHAHPRSYGGVGSACGRPRGSHRGQQLSRRGRLPIEGVGVQPQGGLIELDAALD